MPINKRFLEFRREINAGGVSALVVAPVRRIEHGADPESIERLDPIPSRLLVELTRIGAASLPSRVLGELSRTHDFVKSPPVLCVHKAMGGAPLQLFRHELDEAQSLLVERTEIEDGQALEWRRVRRSGFRKCLTSLGSQGYRLGESAGASSKAPDPSDKLPMTLPVVGPRV